MDSLKYSGPDGLNDIATSLHIHSVSGKLLVTISNENVSSQHDYLLLEVDLSTFAVSNSGIYNYSNLNDIPLGIEEENGTNNIVVIGGSQSSAIVSAYALAIFDPVSFTVLGDARTDLSGSPQDHLTAFAKDNSNNLYLTGKTFAGGHFNIKTVKVLANYSIAWTQTVDVSGDDDAGTDIYFDAATNEVVVGGYCTNASNKKEIFIVRYSGSSGVPVCSHRQAAEDPTGDAFVQKLTGDSNGRTYFLGAEYSMSGVYRTIVGRLSGNCSSQWQKHITRSYNTLPSDIKTSSEGIFVTSVVDSVTPYYLLTRFTELELDTAMIYGADGPVCKKRELIVRFSASALDSAFADNFSRSFTALQQVMTPAAHSSLLAAFNPFCLDCPIDAVKIFPAHSTTLTHAYSRQGDLVALPDFWTALVLQFPASVALSQAYGALSALPGIVDYVHPNFVVQLKTGPAPGGASSSGAGNDPSYPDQTSLHPSSMFPNAHINVEEAWMIYPEAGNRFIRVGVFDTGIDPKHPDFGYSSANPFGSKIRGWDFQGNQNMNFLPDGGDYTPHGTPVAGVIGAIRNNPHAIKGIAGGNDSLGNKGVSLFGLRILMGLPFATSLQYIADAIVNSAYQGQPQIEYDYGLHLQNHSWGLQPSALPFYNDSNVALITEAIHTVNRLGVTLVASRGNNGVNNIHLPATVDDDWVITVSGADRNSNYTDSSLTKYLSNYGRGVDIAAPSDIANIRSLAPSSLFGLYGIWSFDRTSAAAPHASGVAALLMGYMNDTTKAFVLAPEDCEQILQLSARPPGNGAPVPNDSVGHGILDAGRALRLVEKPCNRLWHFGTQNFPSVVTKSLTSIGDTVEVTERWKDLSLISNYIQKGKYIVDTWQIDATVSHNLSSNDTIRAYWPRPSRSDVWERVKNKKLVPRERDTILGLTQTQAQLRGYIYKIYDTLGTSLGWWPCDTSFSCPRLNSLFEYSILTRSCNLSITRLEHNNKLSQSVSIYPNPGSGMQTLTLRCEPGSKINIEIFDLMGRKLRQLPGFVADGENVKVQHDLRTLQPSMYLYLIRINEEVICRKFIKN